MGYVWRWWDSMTAFVRGAFAIGTYLLLRGIGWDCRGKIGKCGSSGFACEILDIPDTSRGFSFYRFFLAHTFYG
jgi:hypothetical protein